MLPAYLMVRLLLMMVFNCATECEDMLVKELRPYNYQLDQLIQAVQSRPA